MFCGSATVRAVVKLLVCMFPLPLPQLPFCLSPIDDENCGQHYVAESISSCRSACIKLPTPSCTVYPRDSWPCFMTLGAFYSLFIALSILVVALGVSPASHCVSPFGVSSYTPQFGFAVD